MPKNTIHNFFQKKSSKPTEERSVNNISQASTPLGSIGNTLNMPTSQATAPKKRKASVDPEERPGRRTTPKQAKTTDKSDKKSRLQALLGEGNAQENNLKWAPQIPPSSCAKHSLALHQESGQLSRCHCCFPNGMRMRNHKCSNHS